MKERLIRYTRSAKNVERERHKCIVAFIIWGIICMCFSNNITGKYPNIVDVSIAILLDVSFFTILIWLGTINTLAKKTANLIRENSIIKILLANENAVEIVILVIAVLVVHFIMCVCLPVGASINIFTFFIGAVIILCLDAIVSNKVSQYFEKKLKK